LIDWWVCGLFTRQMLLIFTSSRQRLLKDEILSRQVHGLGT
jgi:hypothetical protein